MSPLSPHLQQRPESALSAFALIELVYEAAAESSLWPRCLRAMAATLSARGTNLVLHGFGPTRYVSLDTPEAGFATINPGRAFETKMLSRRSFAVAWVGDELVDDWHQLRHEGSGQTSLEVFTNESQSLGAADRQLLEAVLPHLARALTLHFKLDTAKREQDTFGACLDELSTGMLLLDRHASVLHANRAARALLDAHCGLVQESGKLRLVDPSAEGTFRARLKSALSGSQRSLSCLKLRDGTTLWLRGLSADHAVAYVASDRQRRWLDPEHLADAFELTPAESRVGSLFASGESVDEIASRLGVTVHTVRLHIKRMQNKTGTHRQATLLRRMLETIPLVNP